MGCGILFKEYPRLFGDISAIGLVLFLVGKSVVRERVLNKLTGNWSFCSQ